MNKICVWSKCHKSVEIHIRDTNLKLHWKARSWYVLFFCKNSFLFNTIVPFFFHCWNSLSSILALLSFYHSNFFSDVRTQFLFFLSNFLLHRPLSFHPLNFSFFNPLFYSPVSFFFFRIFRFPSLRIRVSLLLSSLNFLLPNEKVKKKSIDDIFTNIIPKFIINEVDPRREAYPKRLLTDIADNYPTPKWSWKP